MLYSNSIFVTWFVIRGIEYNGYTENTAKYGSGGMWLFVIYTTIRLQDNIKSELRFVVLIQ